jgi:dihydropteroate synthase
MCFSGLRRSDEGRFRLPIEGWQRGMSEFNRTVTTWRLRRRTLELGRRTLVMGIVNVTPDSFSDGGRFLAPQAAVEHALELLDEGAEILDLGAEIVNDVSGFLWDAKMASVCAQTGCGVVLMHTRGRPEEWSAQPPLAPDALLAVVRAGLDASLEKAAAAGITPESMVLDPGYGFGKRFEENFFLLARQQAFLSLGRPLLAGVSRKSFLGRALAPLHGGSDAPVEDRETASVAALVAAILLGASVVRVHEVRPAAEAARIADAVLAAG